MYIIGLTGGIACGKSLVASILKEKNIPIIDADLIARRVVEPTHPCFIEIKKMFGDEYINESGQLNRAKIAALIFADKKIKKQYDEILHPVIWIEIEKEIDFYKEQGINIICLDVPLLIETGWQKRVDTIWVVVATENQQIERLQTRNSYTLAESRQRIASQCSTEEKIKQAQVVIDNSRSVEETKKQVLLALSKYLKDDKKDVF